MVTDTLSTRDRAWALTAEVPDPEIPVVTIADLGILRDVEVDDRGWVHVQVTPTYSGCPAMDAIADDVVERLTLAGFQHVDVEFVLSPAWSTDQITGDGLAKLAAYGIAPPQPTRDVSGPVADGAVGALPPVRQPRHPRVQPLRLHGLQVAVGLPVVPRALRPLQGSLVGCRPSTRCGSRRSTR